MLQDEYNSVYQITDIELYPERYLTDIFKLDIPIIHIKIALIL
jgi:hypothetical protein